MTINSLKILKKAVVETNNPEHQLFEESVVLVKSFQENDSISYQQKILDDITKKESTYKNQFGEKVLWKAVLIIDVYELNFKLELIEDYCEVFSRFIEMPPHSTVQDVVHVFYSDYTFGSICNE